MISKEAIADVIIDIVDKEQEHKKIDTFLALVYYFTGSLKMTSYTENAVILNGLPETLECWREAANAST